MEQKGNMQKDEEKNTKVKIEEQLDNNEKKIPAKCAKKSSRKSTAKKESPKKSTSKKTAKKNHGKKICS